MNEKTWDVIQSEIQKETDVIFLKEVDEILHYISILQKEYDMCEKYAYRILLLIQLQGINNALHDPENGLLQSQEYICQLLETEFDYTVKWMSKKK